MGIAPAPPWATIYYAIHENSFLPSWNTNLLFYRRFIDDVFGIWLCDPHPDKNTTLWTSFQNTMQGWYGLEWEFSNLTNTCNFMDLSLSIVDQKIHSTLYEKSRTFIFTFPQTPHTLQGCSVALSMVTSHVSIAYAHPQKTSASKHSLFMTASPNEATTKQPSTHSLKEP